MGAPVKSIFVCGGTTQESTPDNWTRRDTLFRIIDGDEAYKYDSNLDKNFYKKAEQIDAFNFKEHYQDWLTLELDIARISELTLLFCESPGAFAELGAFATDREIAQSLLVVIDRSKYNQNGFIRLGILNYLEQNYSSSSVFVLQAEEMGLTSDVMKGSDIDMPSFARAIGKALETRLRAPLGHRSFDDTLSGHKIKLITGLVQEYGSLTLNEIEYALTSMGIEISDEEINRYLFCAETMEWVSRDKRDYETFFTSTTMGSSLTYKSLAGGPLIDRTRWKITVRDHWRRHDPERFASIVSCMGRMT